MWNIYQLNDPVNLANTVFQPILSTTRQEIKAKLSIGVPVNEVYKELAKVWGIKKLELTTRVSKEHILPARQI